MVTLLPKVQSTGEYIGNALGGGIQQGYSEGNKQREEAFKQKKENSREKQIVDSLKSQTGIDTSGWDPELRKELLKNHYSSKDKPLNSLENARKEQIELQNSLLKDENDQFKNIGNRKNSLSENNENEFNFDDPSSWDDKVIDKFRAMKSKSPRAQTLAQEAQNEYEKRSQIKEDEKKYKEGTSKYKSALSVIDRMRKIGKKNNLGIGTGFRSIYDPQTRKQAGEYEQLGKSLIALSSTIPIRNQKEFTTLSENLFDTSISDAKREGILDGMERIITESLEGFEKPTGKSEESKSDEKPPLSNFLR